MPWVTWVIGGAAFVVLLTAGGLLLHSEAKEQDAEQNSPETPKGEEGDHLSTDPVLASTHPLDLTKIQVDATKRAKEWSPRAMLSSVEMVVHEGIPQGAISVSFGESVGHSRFGAALTPDRFTLQYHSASEQPETLTTQVTHRGSALTEPNCPLHVAYRGLQEAGRSLNGTVGILLMRSEKHDRTVWMFTESSGASHPVDADTCALLRRGDGLSPTPPE